MSGVILDYEHFAIHDGPGIRTVVFLKGCPLRCIWCHTPDSQAKFPELACKSERCLHCGCCGGLSGQLPVVNPDESQLDAVSHCPVRALECRGKVVSAEEVIAEAAKDMCFYQESGGGLTISGGEPLFQPEFTREILHLADAKGIRCCIESCGWGDYKHLQSFIPYTEAFLFDWKASDPELHRRLTGADNLLIRENLCKLNADGAAIFLRCPLVPGINDQDEHLDTIARLAEELTNVKAIHIEPYHPMARGKYLELNRIFDPQLPDGFPPAELIDHYISYIGQRCSKPVLLP